MTRRLVLALLATGAMLLGLSGPAWAAKPVAAVSETMPPVATPVAPPISAPVTALVSVLALGPDCKGDAPLPSSPYGHLAVRPAIVSTADPFTTPGVSIQSVYGTSYKWWTYDNGCSPQDGIMPSLGANIGNLLGLELPGLLPSWGQGLFSLVVDPASWIGSLDTTVATVTASTAAGTWFPWLSVAMTLVAILTLLRARRGQLSGSINAVAWALLVLVVTSWAVSYPVESVKLLDDGVQTAVVDIADGFNHGDLVGPVAARSTADKAAAAQKTLDAQWDTLTRQTVFRSWAEGAFGNADGETARKYGAGVFKATHFSWSEYDTYAKDPAGAGARIIEAKAQQFRQLADEIQQEDPLAYDYFTGNRWGERITSALLGFASVLTVALFLVAAGVFVVGAYVLIRLLLPFSPVAGVVFLVETTRDVALALFKKVVKPLVMGPIFFLAALVVLRYNVGILRSDLPGWLKLVLVFLVAWLVWKMLRPATVLPRIKIPGRGLLSSYLGTRLGTERGQRAADEEAQERDSGQNGIPSTNAHRHHPVHHPPALPAPAPSLFLPASSVPEPVDVVAAGTPVAAIASDSRPRVAIGAGRGTFAPREHVAGAEPFPAVGVRTARESSAGDRPAIRRSTTSPYAAGAGPDIGRHVAPDVVSEDLGPTPWVGPAPGKAGSPPATEAPSPPRPVEGRVLDEGEVVAPLEIDESNLSYDGKGRRVFLVFTTAGNIAVGGSPRES